MTTTLCTSTIHDGFETVRCALEPHAEGTDHRRGFLAWDDKGNWYACREFPDLYPTVGAILREYRERRGLLQQQVAASTNLTRSSIANIERGAQRTPLHVWLAVCQALGANPADVIHRAVQAVGPGVEPLPAEPDKRTEALRRHLISVRADINRLLTDLPGGA